MTESGSLLSLRGVSVKVGSAALLADINLEVNPGERVVILGANGAGKSMLLKTCNGLIRNPEGEVLTPPADQQALIFQRPALLRRSALDNVKFVLAMRGVAEPLRTQEAHKALATCSLSAMAFRPAFALSGGEQQRLALARVWICKPRLWLADEPTANLSPTAVREVEALLLMLQSEGTTLLLTTHNVAQAKRMARRIVFLENGKIVEDRPAIEFFSSPGSGAARAYLESESL